MGGTRRRGALLGLGNVAVHGHLPGWRARTDCEIVAVTDASPARRAVGREVLPAARWHDSVESLLAHEALDFVDICTPPSSHALLIEAALSRRLHVLCEKPLVATPEALARLVTRARGVRRVLHTVHNWHHAPLVRATDAVIRSGRIGTVREVTWHTLRTQPAAAAGEAWRVDPTIAGGGVLTDHGWHVSYVMPRWVGEAPVAVTARLETRRHHRFAVEDTATVQLHFPTATAEIVLTWAADRRDNHAAVVGTAGRITIEGDTLAVVTAQGEERQTCPPPLSTGSQHPDWFGAVAQEFLARIDEGGDPAASANLDEAALCVAIECRARESSRRGGERLALGALLPDGARAEAAG
ncbi:MAG TPA: Gfo/Idh/MocA family oxidoreductase [Methylomirabilota bacterium]|nr:Gfo/Idh/MocA family oxidoreductase [Methylomirabilota bacterium]